MKPSIQNLISMFKRLNSKKILSNVLLSDHACATFERSSCSRFDRMSSFLPWEASDENDIFLLRTQDNTANLSFVIELNTPGAWNEALDETLLGLGSDLPVGATIAISTYASPNIQDYIGPLKASTHSSATGTSRDEIFDESAQRRIDMFEKMSASKLRNKTNVPARNFRHYLSVVLPKTRYDEKAVKSALRIREGMIAVLAQCGMFMKNWSREDLVSTVSEILNIPAVMALDFIPPEINEHDAPADRCVLSDTTYTISMNNVTIESSSSPTAFCATGLYAQKYPRQWNSAMASLLLGELGRGGNQIECPFVTTSICQILNNANQKMLADSHRARALQMSQTPLAQITPYYHEQTREWNIAVESFSHAGGLALISHQMLLLSPKNENVRNVNSARSIARRLGVELRPTTTMHALALLANLPASADEEMMNDLRNAGFLSKRTLANALCGSSIISSWHGCWGRNRTDDVSPLLTLVDRRGQMMHVDPFSNANGGYSISIVGKPGSGKSVVMNTLAFNNLAQGGRVWIIDVGRSYEKLAEILGGDFLIFDESRVWDLNPLATLDMSTRESFRNTLETSVEILSELLSPQRPFSDFEHSVCVDCLNSLFIKKKNENRDLKLSELHDELCSKNTNDQRISDLIIKMKPYLSGPLSRWLDGSGKKIKFDNELTVLELEGLNAHPALRKAALMTLMTKITAAMENDRDRSKLVLIDEAWDLMRSGHSGQFIEKGFRRARKHRGAFCVATQSMSDFYTSETARAAWHSADTRIYLRQDVQSIESLDAQGLFKTDAWFKENIRSLTTITNAYSEMIVKVGDGPHVVARLILDDFMRILFSTHPQDVTDIKGWLNVGATIAEAVKAVASSDRNPSSAKLELMRQIDNDFKNHVSERKEEDRA